MFVFLDRNLLITIKIWYGNDQPMKKFIDQDLNDFHGNVDLFDILTESSFRF